ncbi:MAG: prepilin-type N-terminal cleavage/methylation domain-containing protein [bacterium]|nr:prepilin-type N-terminal cleavage/methylation domain-containing protein [bacterium]
MNKFSKGFTLLEVMVAISILAVALLAVSNFQGNSLRASGRAEKQSLAVQLARLKMNEKILEVEQGIEKGEFPDKKEEEGEFEEYPDFRWKITLDKMEPPPIPNVGEESQGVVEQLFGFVGEKLSQMMRVIKVQIAWKELLEEESIEVTTHIANLKTGATSFQAQTEGTEQK